MRPCSYAGRRYRGGRQEMSATPVTFSAGTSATVTNGNVANGATGAIGVGDDYLTDELGVRLQDELGIDLTVPGVASDMVAIDPTVRRAGGMN